MGNVEEKERKKLRNWLVFDKKLVEFWFRLIEYSIITGILHFVGGKTDNIVVNIAFYISALALWWLIDSYSAYIFEPYLFSKRKFLVKIAVLSLSAIFSFLWVMVIVSVSSEISKTGAF